MAPKLTSKAVVLLIFIMFSIIQNVKAQDISFSQFYLNPLYLNPACAGSVKSPRIGLQYRNQWPELNKAFTTYFVSYDNYIKDYKCGVGALIFSDVQANGLFTRNQFELIYSKKIQIGRDVFIHAGLTASLNINSLNWDKMVFADALDPSFGLHGTTIETPPVHYSRVFPDFSTGIIYYNANNFVGVSIHHLAQPNQSFYTTTGNKARLPRKYTIHYEHNFDIYINNRLKKFVTLNPEFQVQLQGRNFSATYGLYMNRKWFALGASARQTSDLNTDMIIMCGYLGNQLKVGFSYDVNIRGVGFGTGNASEISISYLLKDTRKNVNIPFYRRQSEWEE